jgi:hypothetical protein
MTFWANVARGLRQAQAERVLVEPPLILSLSKDQAELVEARAQRPGSHR